jgi:hypothetical protein
LAINAILTIGGVNEPQWLATKSGSPNGMTQVKIPVPSAHTGPRAVTVRLMSARLRPGQVVTRHSYRSPIHLL